MDHKLRTIELSTSRGFLASLLEEKAHQFGFNPDDLILEVDVSSLPETIPIKFKFKKEKEAKVIIHNAEKELR